MIQYPDMQPATQTCANGGCEETFNSDHSHRIGVGISHYKIDPKKGLVRSYAQVFNTQHCCGRDCAVEAAKARIDQHGKIPFGVYDPATHNPDEAHITHDNAQQLVEYNTVGITPKDQLPKVDAITGNPLTNEWYIPHVDDSSRGTTYQDILKRTRYPNSTYEQLTLGTATLENAQELAKAIIDEIIQPDYHSQNGTDQEHSEAVQEVAS